MVDRDLSAVGAHTSSTGQVLAQTGWLDTHFEACRPEYEAMLRSVGIRPGWRVLDAGSGSGSLLPLLAELVGPAGEVLAVDVAEENVAAVSQRLAELDLAAPVEVRVGSVAELPLSDGELDAVWCANVVQYFGDDELAPIIAELRRVIRPGGLVAVKDVDMQLARIAPGDPFLISHLCEASVRGPDATAQSIGSLRGRDLRRWLERAGLEDVWQQTTMIERWAPLRPVERQLWADWLAFLAGLAEERGVPDADLAAWRALADPDSRDHLVDRPDFYACEGQVVAVGRVGTDRSDATPRTDGS